MYYYSKIKCILFILHCFSDYKDQNCLPKSFHCPDLSRFYNWTSLISLVNIKLSCCSNQNTVGQFAVPHTQKHAHVPFIFVSACQMEGSEGVESSWCSGPVQLCSHHLCIKGICGMTAGRFWIVADWISLGFFLPKYFPFPFLHFLF